MPIHVLCGEPGSGKTYVATALAHRYADRKKPVVANWPISHPGIGYFTNDQLFDQVGPNGRTLRVFLDEAQQEFHSRNWASLPPEVYQRWNMVRRGAVDLWLLTQDFENLDSTLRRSAHYVYDIVPHWKMLSARDEDEQHPLTFTLKGYRKRDYRKKDARPMHRRTFFFRKAVAASYDTLQEFDHSWSDDAEPDVEPARPVIVPQILTPFPRTEGVS